MNHEALVIIGAGLAGYLFAKEFRKRDANKPLIILTKNDGAFYSKPLLSTALINRKTAADLVVQDAETMSKTLNATIYTHTSVEQIDPQARIVKTLDREVAYDQLILACGSQARPLGVVGDAVADIPSVNDLASYAQFRQWLNNKKEITILGSGLVGLEFANDLITAGYRINLLSSDAYPLAKQLPEPVAEAVKDVFIEKGVVWHFNDQVSQVMKEKQRYHLLTKTGKAMLTDGIFSAIGIQAVCDLAACIPLETRKGIVVDRYLRTSIPHIYALGDCAEVLGELRQYVAPILQCARTLAQYLVDASCCQPVQYQAMPTVVKTSICPIVVEPPPAGVSGDWEYSGKGRDQCALYHDTRKNLRGFALIGECVQKRVVLAKAIPPVFTHM